MNINLNKAQLISFFDQFYITDIKKILKFSQVTLNKELKYKKDYVNCIVSLFLNNGFVDDLLQKLNIDETSKKFYSYLIWNSPIVDTSIAIKYFGVPVKKIVLDKKLTIYEEMLSGSYGLLQRTIHKEWNGIYDYIKLDANIRAIFKIFYPKPKDYELLEVEKLDKTEYSYNNEEGVLVFINSIKGMLEDNLIEFGKTNEKPLLKTLNILKTSTQSNEFYSDKKLNNLATDMLTRSFSYYSWQGETFYKKEQDTLKDLFKKIFANNVNFFISRIFLSHLKRVRFDYYYSSQDDIFEMMKLIVTNLISKGWVDIDNIINFCKYREIDLHIESADKTENYYMLGDNDSQELMGYEYYHEIYYEPLIKASMFYMGALGVLELRYDDPTSPYDIKAKDLPYISSWDSLKYVKLTKLGDYVLGVDKTYKAKKIEKVLFNIKFDEYKPIITLDKTDNIMIAKLEPFVEKYDDRYILSYSKIFKDCKNIKMLNAKIDGFYKLFDTKPPEVFDVFFKEIKENSNMLKRDLKLITIELNNNKKLLTLFMNNKKLKEYSIKASGYRVLVSKENIPKVTKIVKDNGFFVEF